MDWYGPDKATFGDRLVAAREKSNLSQQDLAKRLGVKSSTIKSWENDNSEPRANRLSMLAGLLNVSITWLISAEGSGVEAPKKMDEMPDDLHEVLKELTALRLNLLKNVDRINNIEKKLRASGKLNQPMGELEIIRKRLYMRSMRRGTKEMDLILKNFAQLKLHSMSEPELENFENLQESLKIFQDEYFFYF